jgi:hypothetical protein
MCLKRPDVLNVARATYEVTRVKPTVYMFHDVSRRELQKAISHTQKATFDTQKAI